MISSNDHIQKWSKNWALRQHSVTPISTPALSQKMRKETVCPWTQQQSDGDKGQHIGMTESAGHISALGLSSNSDISCTYRLRISHWGREGRVSEGCDEGQWLRLPYLGWWQKQRHESPVKPVRKGQFSIQKINSRLAGFQEEIRWRDAGGSVSTREMFQSIWDEREDWPEDKWR